ncbi:MAG TPA: hypothetical protein VLE51_02485 [Candidatus Saccharimonadales bacterium]|nr:hypothetical protein [Candidatus Saccharimonadales bacterium]
MEIKDFVSETLKQITEGAKVASSQKQFFFLDNNTSKGVHFNLAVANTETSTKANQGKANANLLKVVSVGGGKSNSSTISSESISRVEFNITYITPASSGVVRSDAPRSRID